MKTIIINDYPATFVFETSVKLPAKFEYGCKVRTKILQDYLNAHPKYLKGIEHLPEDFTVEQVEKGSSNQHELWEIGS